MASINKKISLFCATVLSSNYTFLFTFNAAEPPSVLQPINAWKVSNFSGGVNETQSVPLHYIATLGASVVHVDDDNFIHPSVAESIKTQQNMSLAEVGGSLQWTNLQNDSSLPNDTAKVINNAPTYYDIGVGFMNGPAINVALVSPNVPVHSSISIQLHPSLSVYATSQFQENQVITVEIGTPILYTWDFESVAVSDGSCYELTEDPDTLELIIKPYTGECPPSLLPNTSRAYGNLYTHIQCWLGSMVRLGSPWAC